MKTKTRSWRAAVCSAAFLAAAAKIHGTSHVHPERFGVINIVPNVYSAEYAVDSEPSLGAALNSGYGKVVVHALSNWKPSLFYASVSAGYVPWTKPLWSISNYDSGDAMLDWAAGGTAYLALSSAVSPFPIHVLSSSDPTTTDFTTTLYSATIPGGAIAGAWLRAVTVTNVDHIFVAFYDGWAGASATVRYSMNGGANWNMWNVDQVVDPNYKDFGVLLAPSSDGKTVYALFQRLYTGFNNFGDVVLVRDDGYGGTGFGALGKGTLILDGWNLPSGNLLVSQDSGIGCDVAVQPYRNNKVYVAVTEMDLDGDLHLRVRASIDSGKSFGLALDIRHATMPSLAVASDGTVGLLYLAWNPLGYLEVHFLKALLGNFGNIKDRVLAKFPDLWTLNTDHFALRAAGHNFFGAFCAPNYPNPNNFPSGVFYQRNLLRYINGGHPLIENNIQLVHPGQLVDLDGNSVTVSLDPFFFYDIAGSFTPPFPPYISWILSTFFSLEDPFSGIDHLSWPLLPSSEPPIELQTADTLGLDAQWTPPTAAQGVSIIQTNGQNFATFVGSDPQRFFRLKQNLTGSQFLLFAAAGDHGSLAVPAGGGVLGPDGVMTNAALSSATFFATATNDYYVDKWYLDGVAVQTNAPSLTVSNIASEHTLVVTFSPSNDLAVTLFESSGVRRPTETVHTNTYVVEIANQGLNALSGVSMMNMLDPMVGFVSATTSQGTVNYVGGQVIANVGSLNPGDLVTVNIQFIPFFATTIVDTANVVCDQSEPDLSNNSATVSTVVIDPVVITNQPASLTLPAGATATFSVGASGTPPLTYQWYFNGTNAIDNATSATLTLTNVTATQAGGYSVSVLQILDPKTIESDNSAPATLIVQ
jgi:hypothetical protein